MSHNIRIGTSGWNYDHWKGRFYPEDLPQSRWYAHYCETFDTVEINNTFYQPPENKTFDAWREQAPRGFVYAVKANRYLTHMRKLNDPREPLDRFLGGIRRLKRAAEEILPVGWDHRPVRAPRDNGPELQTAGKFSSAARLKDHLGPILYQLPPNWQKNLGRLRSFAELLPSDLTHVIEIRDRDWLAEDTYELMAEYDLCLCVHDMLPRHPRRVTGPVVYVRFHGTGQKYGGKYRPSRLQGWADWIGEVAHDRNVFVYFNNDAQAHAVRDAQELRRLIGEPAKDSSHA